MSIKNIILKNRKWASSKGKDFFENLSEGQNPSILWIGCSDSRVPPDTITQSEPGNIFVHRNIANLIFNDDLNLLSILEYSINVLKIKNIIICGHYGCGGIKAAMGKQESNNVDKWINNIRKTISANKEELDLITNETSKWDRLVELNILEQINNLKKCEVVKKAIEKNKKFFLHPLVFDLKNGNLLHI